VRKVCLSRRSAGCVALLLATVSGVAHADELPLFQSDKIIRAVLTAPITQAYAQQDQEARLYLPGQFSFVDETGKTVRLTASIRTRGNFRRMYCELAPLQLNFKKSQVVGTLFEGQDKLKLVAPCFDRPSYQRYVMLEYLAYRILGILTDYSYRTRLFRLSYIDSDEQLLPWTVFAFVIEDESDLESRLGLQRLDVPAVDFAELNRDKTALAELFEFLIGNNDYSVLQVREGDACCHNTEILATDEAGLRIPVPFDFDFSGFVNAIYAAPPSNLPIARVRQRYYKGLCHPPGVLKNAIAHVLLKRDEIFALIENQEELSEKGRRDATRYMEYFYDILDDPKRLEREVYERCRGKNLLDAMMESSTGPA